MSHVTQMVSAQFHGTFDMSFGVALVAVAVALVVLVLVVLVLVVLVLVVLVLVELVYPLAPLRMALVPL